MERGVGAKNDAGKARMDLLPFVAVESVAGVLTYGAKKYAPDNWRKVKGWRWRYFGAGLRHLVLSKRERLDPESGLPHLAHAVCSFLFLLELEIGNAPNGDDPA